MSPADVIHDLLGSPAALRAAFAPLKPPARGNLAPAPKNGVRLAVGARKPVGATLSFYLGADVLAALGRVRRLAILVTVRRDGAPIVWLRPALKHEADVYSVIVSKGCVSGTMRMVLPLALAPIRAEPTAHRPAGEFPVDGTYVEPTGAMADELACLLGAIHPSINAASDCPANLMPNWMARLTIQLFDGIPRDRTREFALAYADRLHRWRVIDADGWERVRRAFIASVMGDALSGWSARVGDNPSPDWAAIKALYERIQAALIGNTASLKDYRAWRDEAYALRSKAWATYHAAVRRRRAAEAAAVAAVAAAVAAAAVAAARRASYVTSFETILRLIDAEIGDR